MALPANLKAIQPYLKVATDMRKREPVVAFHSDMHAMQTGMKIDSKSPDCKQFLIQLMTSLEKQKGELSKDPERKEQVSSEVSPLDFDFKFYSSAYRIGIGLYRCHMLLHSRSDL